MILKDKKIFLSLGLILILLTGCEKFLDTTPEDLRSPDQIYETYQSTENAMFGVYSYVRTYNPASMPGMLSTSDLDVVYTNVMTFDMGTWTATGAQYDKWYSYYRAIHAANYFLQNVDKTPEQELDNDTKMQWKAEVRTLRAYFYVQLMRMYGPVILMGDEITDINEVNLDRPRNTWDECVAYVTGELDAMAENDFLPVVQTGDNYGRMSQAIAMAYKARLLLQSASPQFNGNPMYFNVTNPDGTHLFPIKADPNKWKLAKQAAQDVIDLNYYQIVKVEDNNGDIDPYASYKSVFTETKNKEMIFSYLEDGGYIDFRLAPNSSGAWGGGYNPTQEMVDLYAMENGKYPITGYTSPNRDEPVIDPTSGYSETGFSQFTNPVEKIQRNTFNMFVNREPRFYVSVVYGGMTWFIPNKVSERIYLEMYKNGNNGPDASHNYYSTGYNIVKLAMPGFEARPTKNVKQEVTFMRYAEILLDYVEACIESGDLSDPKLLLYWNMVRERAGVPDIQQVYPDALGNQEKLRELLHKERRVEFAFEGISFYDTRRWLVAQNTESNFIHGMNIQAVGNPGSDSYPVDFFQRTRVEDRVFTPSYYLFPIPQSAMDRNDLLIQNFKW